MNYNTDNVQGVQKSAILGSNINPKKQKTATDWQATYRLKALHRAFC